jgi:hypothetical protein
MVEHTIVSKRFLQIVQFKKGAREKPDQIAGARAKVSF